MSTDNPPPSQIQQNQSHLSQPGQQQIQPQTPQPTPPDLDMGPPRRLTESFDPANLTTKAGRK
jgi:hypothetical protein